MKIATLAFVLVPFGLAGCMEAEPVHTNASSATAEAEQACLEAVAAQTNRPLSDHSVGSVLTAEAGIGVDINVAGADNHWSCLSDAAGNVQGAAYVGEG